MTPAGCRKQCVSRHSVAGLLLAATAVVGCGESSDGSPVLTAEVPLHLEEHLDVASVEGSDIPEKLPQPVVWRFDEAQPDWRPVTPRDSAQTTGLEPVEGALRIHLRHPPPASEWITLAPDGIYIDLPDWDREDWAYIEVQARAAGVATLGPGNHATKGTRSPPSVENVFQ